jgi:predicted transcriptional regulator
MIYRNNEQLVNELKKVMIDTGTKQVDLAKKLEVPKQAITKIFDKKNLTCDDMQKLLALMGYELRVEFVPVENGEK